MAKIDDPRDLARKLERELELQEQSEEMADETVRRVSEFADAHLRGEVADDEELALASLLRYCRQLRYTAESLACELAAVDDEELGAYLDEVSRRYSATTHNGRRAALVKFNDYHDDDVVDWRAEWESVSQDTPEIDLDRLFTDDEVRELLEAGDVRERALIGLLADLGPRISALCSFRIRDLYIDEGAPEIRFNTDAPTKRASGRVLLTWSAGYLESYLAQEHPRPDDPNAPLLHKTKHYDPDDPDDDGALHPGSVGHILRKLAGEANIATDRMKPHNFRHTAVSNWILQGWNVDDIVHRASWASPAMLEIYDNVTDEQRNESQAARLGLVDEDEVLSEPGDALMDCPRCSTTVRRDARYCPRCSLALTHDAASAAADSPEPGVPGDDDPEVWPDGGGLEDVPTEALVRKLVERGDVDPSDLLED